jgi:hypothetical protein
MLLRPGDTDRESEYDHITSATRFFVQEHASLIYAFTLSTNATFDALPSDHFLRTIGVKFTQSSINITQ